MKSVLAALTVALCVAALAGEPAPARELVAFCSDRAGQWRIWLMAPDGSDVRQLTEGTDADDDVDPAVSPDGAAVLFTSTRGEATGVWRIGLGGEALERICDGDQAEWSPDGKSICLRRNNAIVVRELATGKERVLTDEAWPLCAGPAWSPDGVTIAFACRWDGGNSVCVVPAEGGPPRKVYDKQGACEPHWSPDGTRLVYETETHVCTVKPDGTENRLVTTFGGVQRYGRYSPDGASIIFCQGMSERGPWEIYVIPAAGGAPRKLTEDASDMHPHWARLPAE